jgi:hypothetical protein
MDKDRIKYYLFEIQRGCSASKLKQEDVERNDSGLFEEYLQKVSGQD